MYAKTKKFNDKLKSHNSIKTIKILVADMESGLWNNYLIKDSLGRYNLYSNNEQHEPYSCEGRLWKELILAWANCNEDYKDLFLKMLLEVSKKSDILCDEFNDRRNGCGIITSLLRICFWNIYWVKDLESWTPKSHNPKNQFYSLVQHLFAKYKVPSFFYTCWLAPHTDMDPEEVIWFITVAQGMNVTKCSIIKPEYYPMNKKISHIFMNTPERFCESFEMAWKYALVKYTWGSNNLARTFSSIPFGTLKNDLDFLISIVRFFSLNDNMFDHHMVGPMLDYIRIQKMGPQPNFSMAGRTIPALIDQVREWHIRLGNKRIGKEEWPDASGISDYMCVTGKDENRINWKITQIRHSEDLRREGRELKHCCVSYLEQCIKGTISMWSLSKEDYLLMGKKRTITIEVNNSLRQVVQARGYCNRSTTGEENNIIRLWSRLNDLKAGRSWSM